MYDSMVAACHHYVLSAAAATANTLVLDFDIPGPIVNDRDLFWAPIHYWLMTADCIIHDIIAALSDSIHVLPDYRVISHRFMRQVASEERK
ncbi:hypothetical protein D3W54_14150 [Komagataeibacter medellinensis]|uniref:Uncharacterized protein n=1 Tax=Komagataeibacter medellinensis TaxID=1177712 RepID=A0ABQ6VSK2_9PROT|nr:hypothetical protein [Komagataeibacter medellinensis]KAB8122350.1 hypothetical protein D3W54_14150 [Komagataeibacter medellinensis]